MRRLFAALAFTASLLACEAKQTNCYPSDYRACSCAAGRTGLQACSTVGDSYGACDCSGAIPVPAMPDSGPPDSGADGAALATFGMSCTMDSDCPSGACFVGGMRSFCSFKCGTPADCPTPPTAGVCNMRGYCKAP